MSLNRRGFLKKTLYSAGVAGGVFAIGGTKSSGAILGANDTVRVAVAGLNGRGTAHTGAYSKMKGVEIACLVDPDKGTYAKHIKTIEGAGGRTPATVQDIRQALEDKNIDAVSIATPNHWHALMTIWACQAGKDVYVEKPSSHNVREGHIALDAARHYKRIVQHGTQSRSGKGFAEVAAVIRSGKLGKLLVSRGLCYKKRDSIGTKPTGTPPEDLNFDLWLGPAPTMAFHKNLVHYNWHWFWETGNGDIGNQGVHQMDIARWAIPDATLPTSVVSVGGRFGYEDQGETPNTQISVMEFGSTLLIFEVRGRPCKSHLGQGVGNIFHLEAGTIAGTKFFPKGSDKEAPLPSVDVAMGPGGGDHFGNFIAAVRSRNVADLNADILHGHYSSALCHLANISYRLGKDVPAKQARTALKDAAALETLDRMEEHLKSDVKLSLDGLGIHVGPKLAFDPASETFVDNNAANALLTRTYRAPYVVPSKIG